MIFSDDELKAIIIEGVEKYTDDYFGDKNTAASHNLLLKRRERGELTMVDRITERIIFNHIFDSIYS